MSCKRTIESMIITGLEDMTSDEFNDFLVVQLDELGQEDLTEVLSKTDHMIEDRGLDDLTSRISSWHHERKITINGNALTQTVKLMEEAGELAAGIVRNDKDEIKDALGDMYVVMVAIAELSAMDIEDCIKSAYNEIRDRTGHLNEHGNFVKEEK